MNMALGKTFVRLMVLSIICLAFYASFANAKDGVKKRSEANNAMHRVKRQDDDEWGRLQVKSDRTKKDWGDVRKVSYAKKKKKKRRRAIKSDEADWREDDYFRMNKKDNSILDTITDSERSEMVLTDYRRGIFMVTSPEKKTCNIHVIPEHMKVINFDDWDEAIDLMHKKNERTGKPIQATLDKKYVMRFNIDDKAVNTSDLNDDIIDICQKKHYKMQWMKPVATKWDEFQGREITSDNLSNEENETPAQDAGNCGEAWFCNWIYMGAWREEEYCCSATWFECERNCIRKTWLPVYRFKCGMGSTCNN